MMPPGQCSDRELSPQELADILKAKPVPRSENTQSRAVASAMRALQQRIKELESANEALSSSAKDNEFFQMQLEFCESENKRLQEQHTIDKENWALQVESLKSQGNEENSKKLKRALMESGAKLEESKLKAQGLENTVREKDQRIRELEEQNKNLAKLCENHAKKIKKLTGKTKKKGHSPARKRSLSVSKTRTLNTSQKDIRVPSTAPSYLKKPSLPSRIAALEQELSELNKHYKSLLLSNSSEFSSLRAKLEEIGLLMEEKSKSLYSLKRKQQEELKAKLAL